MNKPFKKPSRAKLVFAVLAFVYGIAAIMGIVAVWINFANVKIEDTTEYSATIRHVQVSSTWRHITTEEYLMIFTVLSQRVIDLDLLDLLVVGQTIVFRIEGELDVNSSQGRNFATLTVNDTEIINLDSLNADNREARLGGTIAFGLMGILGVGLGILLFSSYKKSQKFVLVPEAEIKRQQLENLSENINNKAQSDSQPNQILFQEDNIKQRKEAIGSLVLILVIFIISASWMVLEVIRHFSENDARTLNIGLFSFVAVLGTFCLFIVIAGSINFAKGKFKAWHIMIFKDVFVVQIRDIKINIKTNDLVDYQIVKQNKKSANVRIFLKTSLADVLKQNNKNEALDLPIDKKLDKNSFETSTMKFAELVIVLDFLKNQNQTVTMTANLSD